MSDDALMVAIVTNLVDKVFEQGKGISRKFSDKVKVVFKVGINDY